MRWLLVTTTANGPGGAGVGVAFGVGVAVVWAEAVGRADPVPVVPGDGAQPPSAVPAATRQQAVVMALRSIGFPSWGGLRTWNAAVVAGLRPHQGLW